MELSHVNVYLVKCRDGYGLVDVGLATYDSALALLRGLKSLGIKPEEITKVFVIHFHADHIALAQFLAEISSPDFHVGEGEISRVTSNFDDVAKMYAEKYKRHGTPAEVAEAFLKVHPMSRFRKSFKDVRRLQWRPVRDGEDLDCGLGAISTPGHTPGHTVYVAEHGIFTGDHVLPKITPNISWYPISRFNLLKECLKSLKKISINARGYPAHGDEIGNLALRIEQLVRHHEKRLKEVMAVLREPMTTYQVSKNQLGRWAF